MDDFEVILEGLKHVSGSGQRVIGHKLKPLVDEIFRSLFANFCDAPRFRESLKHF